MTPMLEAIHAIDDRYLLHALTYRRKRRSAAPWLAVAACLCLIAAAAWPKAAPALPDGPQTVQISGCYPEFTLEDLVEQSSLVALCTVREASAAIEIEPSSGGGHSLFTDWTMEVDEVYRGEAEADTLILRLQGGENEWLRVVVEDGPELHEGEQYLLFLYRPGPGGYVTEGEFYYPMGGSRGIWHAAGDSFERAYDAPLPRDELLAQIAELSAALPLPQPDPTSDPYALIVEPSGGETKTTFAISAG